MKAAEAICYSYRNASIGSNLAALYAGYVPNSSPTPIEIPAVTIIVSTEIEGTISRFNAFVSPDAIMLSFYFYEAIDCSPRRGAPTLALTLISL